MSDLAGWLKRGLLAGVMLAGCCVMAQAAEQQTADEAALERKAAEAQDLGDRNRAAIDKKAAESTEKATYSLTKGPTNALGTTRRYDNLLAADAPLRVRWSLPIGGAKIRRLTVPADDSGLKYLLVETEQNDLVAVRRDNGEALWWVKCAAPIFGNIFVGNYSVMFISQGRIVRLERMSGDVIWNVQLPFAPSAGPCAMEDNEKNVMVFVPGMDRGVYGFDITSEVWPPKNSDTTIRKSDFAVELHYYRPLWKFFSAGVVGNSMLYYDNRVFTGCWNDRIYGLNLNGATNNGRPEDVWEFRPRSGAESAPVTDGIYIFVASLDNNLYCLNRQSGTLIWRYVAEDRLYATPQIAFDKENEKVFIIQKVGKNGALICMRRDDGTPIWQSARGTTVVAAQQDDNANPMLRRVLVVATDDGMLNGVCASAPDKRTKEQKALDQQQQTVPEATLAWSIANVPFSGFASNTYDPYIFAISQDGQAVIALEKND